MRRMDRVSALLSTLVTAAILVGLSAPAAMAAQDEYRRIAIEFVMFSEDSTEYLIKVTDPNAGTLFHVRNTKTNELVKGYPFSEDNEKKILKKMARKHDMTQAPHEDAAHPRKDDVLLMGAQKGKKFNIYVMRDDRARRLNGVTVIKDKDENYAKANLKQLVYDQRGKYVVVVYHQKLPGEFAFEGDFLHSFKLKSKDTRFKKSTDGD
jgi:hypothetical protein